jgi:hypothetical protein
MKMLSSAIVFMGSFFLAVGNSQSELVIRGGGLVYDTDTNLTWLQDANLAATNDFGVAGVNADGSMDWETANLWVGAMNAEKYFGYNDWRLPSTNLSISACGGPEVNGYLYNCAAIEFGHIYYDELKNKAPYNTLGIFFPRNGIKNSGPFMNLDEKSYWSATEWPFSPADVAYRFDFSLGGLDETSMYFSFPRAWAVRNGDIALSVPEPTAMLLAVTGIIGLIAKSRKN